MNRAEFDRFADEYRAMHAANISASGESPEFFAEYKVKDVADAAARTGTWRCVTRVLDFGAGIGNSVPFWRRYFPDARTTCVDVSGKSLSIGHERMSADASFVQFDGQTLPFADGSFDIAFAACVFHHIEHDRHVHLLRELRRVLSPDGTMWVFEHNPNNPLTVKAVNDCPFDANACLVQARQMRRRMLEAGFAEPRVRYRIFFPGPLRVLRKLEPTLVRLPLGAQYSVSSRP
ncbi:MAG: methyltransferase domain-containing protein [Burkholderiales bacterium]|nr:methyltransferase domain-containing protein [Burkholderiales bacterium]